MSKQAENYNNYKKRHFYYIYPKILYVALDACVIQTCDK